MLILGMLCRYSLLFFPIAYTGSYDSFYLVSKQFRYSVKIFVTHFLAFYRLIDKISSFLLLLSPTFSHFFSCMSPFLFFLTLPPFLCISLLLPQSVRLHLHSLSRIFTLLSPLSVPQHVSLKTWNGPLFNSMSYLLL